MQKFKLFLIFLIVVLFALFIGIEARDFGNGNFAKPFVTSLIFGLCYVIFITLYYAGAKQALVKRGEGTAKDYANPLDIWLLAIPMCVLMVLSHLIFAWHASEVFFCTMMSLSGMLFANNLGRGKGRWHIQKSLPFFVGCIVTIIYSIVIGGMIR